MLPRGCGRTPCLQNTARADQLSLMHHIPGYRLLCVGTMRDTLRGIIRLSGIRLGRYGWVPWDVVLRRIRRQFHVGVTSDFVASLLYADLHQSGAKAKQRLEFLVVVGSPNLSDEWLRIVDAHKTGKQVYHDLALDPFPTIAKIGPDRLTQIWAVRANHGHSALLG